MIRVTLAPTGNGREFRVRIENRDDGATFQTSEGYKTVHLSPGVWAVHGATGALFAAGQPDPGHGLERIAESGNPANLDTWAAPLTGVITGFSPVLWATSTSGEPFFTAGQPDRGTGLEHLAEDGDASAELSALQSQLSGGTVQVALQAMPDGSNAPGPILPGDAYAFRFSAAEGERLSLATMFGASNDWIAATDPQGVALFGADGKPISGDVSDQLALWDLGTEESEEPGVGPDTGPQQPAPNTGAADSNPEVRLVGSSYPTPLTTHLKVTITPVNQ